MRYIVLEDEPLAADRLIHSVGSVRPAWQHLATFESISQGRTGIIGLKPELIFVDIHLADGLSFDLFSTEFKDIPLIFTTAYDQYALKAFALNSIDYLLKPISSEDLERALHKLEMRTGPVAVQWEQFIRDLKPRYKERFLVSTGERMRAVLSDDIAFFFASGKHCFLTDKNGTEYLIDQNLGQLTEVLDPQKFFQINRQFIVQMGFIREMIPWSKSRLKLIMDPPTPEDAVVSVERSPGFKSWVAGELE